MESYKKKRLSQYDVNNTPSDGDLIPAIIQNGSGGYENVVIPYSTLKGVKGDPGAGLLSGGSTNQALLKSSNSDFATKWQTIDKTFVGLGNVTNDAQLKIASNLSDLLSQSAARTNLGLGLLSTKSSIDLSADATGTLPKANGGAGDVNGILKANGSGVVSKAVLGTDYNIPPTIYTYYNPSLTGGETASTGTWVDWTAGIINFTTTGTTRVKVSWHAQGRNTNAGTNGCFVRMLLDNVWQPTMTRSDSPVANSINTQANAVWIDNVSAGSHTVKLQVCRNDVGDGSGAGTATIRQQGISVEVYQIS